MALDDLDAWAKRANGATRAALHGFSERFGFEAGDNEIRLATAAPVLDPELPAEVVEFLAVVDEVSWPDIWNGYFIGPATTVAERFREHDPSSVLIGSEVHKAVVIGSDGGGAYFAVDIIGGGAILHVVEGFVERGVLQGDVRVVATGLDEFLETLLENVAAVVRGEPPAF